MSTKNQSDKRSIYYQSLFGRNKFAPNLISNLVYLCTWPKLILEVFLRRRMGERYFSLGWAIVIAIGLYWLPIPLVKVFNWSDKGLYYAFYLAYLIMTIVTVIEIRRAPSVFDFKRFSLDPGESLSFFKRLRIFGRTFSQRTIDIYLEPLFCFLIGFILILFSAYLTGTLILFCAICYYISNVDSAIRGDHFIMDIIDERICNQDLTDTFASDEEVSPRGVPFYSRKPSTKELREELAIFLSDIDDEAVEVA